MHLKTTILLILSISITYSPRLLSSFDQLMTPSTARKEFLFTNKRKESQFFLLFFETDPLGLLTLQSHKNLEIAEFRLLFHQNLLEKKPLALVLYRIQSVQNQITQTFLQGLWKTPDAVFNLLKRDHLQAFSEAQLNLFFQFQPNPALKANLLKNNEEWMKMSEFFWGPSKLTLQKWRPRKRFPFQPFHLSYFLSGSAENFWENQKKLFKKNQRDIKAKMNEVIKFNQDLPIFFYEKMNEIEKKSFSFEMKPNKSQISQILKDQKRIQNRKEEFDLQLAKRKIKLLIHLPEESSKSYFLAQLNLKQTSKKLHFEKRMSQKKTLDYQDLIQNQMNPEIMKQNCQKKEGDLFLKINRKMTQFFLHEGEAWTFFSPRQGLFQWPQFIRTFLNTSSCQSAYVQADPVYSSQLLKTWNQIRKWELNDKLIFRIRNHENKNLLLFPGFYHLLLKDYEDSQKKVTEFSFVVPESLQTQSSFLIELNEKNTKIAVRPL